MAHNTTHLSCGVPAFSEPHGSVLILTQLHISVNPQGVPKLATHTAHMAEYDKKFFTKAPGFY